jgi:hypothetical protein
LLLDFFIIFFFFLSFPPRSSPRAIHRTLVAQRAQALAIGKVLATACCP